MNENERISEEFADNLIKSLRLERLEKERIFIENKRIKTIWKQAGYIKESALDKAINYYNKLVLNSKNGSLCCIKFDEMEQLKTLFERAIEELQK